jgi:lipopolysaccharide export system permease protein
VTVRILDRERYWAFLKAYVTCYISLVGLWVVIDAFSNVDEFMKRTEGAASLFQAMSRYYLIHQLAMFDMLAGVITMMAAIFAVTWVQKNNEMLAMLAAGVSTQRIIRPVLISSVLVSSFAIINQEFVMPMYAEELQKSHDDDGKYAVPVSSRYDTNGNLILGKEADRESQSIQRFSATIDRALLGQMHELHGEQATYIPEDDARAPLRGGWLVRGQAQIGPEMNDDDLADTGGLITKVTDLSKYPPPKGDEKTLSGDSYFLKSSLNFQAVTRKQRWFDFANTWELLNGLADRGADPRDSHEIALFLHNRLLRPAMSLILLFMTLPLVLSGYGRNSFISLGLALGNSAMFYSVQLVARWLGGSYLLSPEMASWAPVMGFAGLATIRWGRIRT